MAGGKSTSPGQKAAYQAYKSSGREVANKTKNLAKAKAFAEEKAAKPPKTPRGAARAARRAAAAASGIQGENFPDIWKEFCSNERINSVFTSL